MLASARKPAAVGCARIPLRESHLELPDSKRLGDHHLALRAFIAATLSLIRRRSHELAGWDYHHLGAIWAVLEAVLRLQAPARIVNYSFHAIAAHWRCRLCLLRRRAQSRRRRR